MTRHAEHRWWTDALRGALGGAIATRLMDLVTTGLMEGQSKETTQEEKAARPNGKSSVGNLVDRLAGVTGVHLDDGERSKATQLVHYGLGVVPGAIYGVVRPRMPILAAGRGVLYGMALWAINDEYLNTKLGFAGPFTAYPVETHVRGAVGHAVLGGATDLGIDLLGG
jgi:hypothetical protein